MASVPLSDVAFKTMPTTDTKPTPAPTPEATSPTKSNKPAHRPQQRRSQKSRYGTQMAEKQQLKQIYGIAEQQLRNYYAKAHSAKAETGPQLVMLLESRLDNAVYRAGFAPTRPAARQMATHRLLMVNDRPVDIPSYRLKPGDTVTVRPGKRGKALFSNFDKRMQNVKAPTWIVLDPTEFSFSVSSMPTMSAANVGVDVQAIVEYFAR